MLYDITSLYAASLGVLTAGLGFATVIMRAKTNISFGHGDNRPLERAIRAHGNLIEYTPIFLILLLILENTGLNEIWLHGLGGAFVSSRLISALYFWVKQSFALRVIALWGAVLPIMAGAILLLI